MLHERKVVFAWIAFVTLAALSSAGGCGSREEDEHLGKTSQALDGAIGDGGCREVTLQASRAQGGEHSEDERELSPSLRFAVPSEIALSGTKNSGAHWVDLEIESVSGSEITCRYKGGANNPNDRALLFSCSGGVHAGDIVTAGEVKLEIENGSVVTARVTLAEASPCGPDASMDAAGGADGGAGADASGDAAGTGSDATTCTAASCDTHNACSLGQCTTSGCTTTPAAAGTACSVSACTVGDTCNGAGSCVAGALVPIDDGNPCTVDQCDPVLGVIHTPVAAGTSCSDGNACNGLETCDATAVCQPGTPPVIDDGNPCTADSCDPIAGVTHTPLPAGDPACSDGNACNGIESCNGAGVCVAGTPPVLDDGTLCTVDACSPSTGVTHTPIPSCDPTPVQGDAPFETRASLLGRLVTRAGAAVTGATFTVTEAPAPDGSGLVRTDVSASVGGDGSFRLRLTTFPDVATDRTPPLHVIVRVDAGGVLPAFRDTWLHTGTAADLGIIKMIPRDPASTPIGPAGGTANDSANSVQVVVPPGALTTTINVVITPFAARDEFPAPLPDSTATMYGFEFEPSGTQFAVPVTVRIANTLAIPTTFSIPTGFFDPTVGRWEHVAQATWDGSRFAFATTHFTSYDGNGNKPADPAPVQVRRRPRQTLTAPAHAAIPAPLPVLALSPRPVLTAIPAQTPAVT